MSPPQPSESRTAWTEPSPQDLGGGIYRIPLPLPNDGLRAVNIYALQTSDGLVMIDGGWALSASADRLRKSLAELDFSLTDISRFLVTHVHRDHYTQAIAVRREVGAPVALGLGERVNLDRIQQWLDSGRPTDDYAHLHRAGADDLRQLIQSHQGQHQPDPADWELPDEWLADTDEVRAGNRTLRVIATPGHTRGHVVFYDAQAGLLFAGDHVLPHITPSIGFEPARPAFPLRDYLDSLRLLHTMPDARLLPAHGPVASSVHERVTELLDHHEQRLADSAEVVKVGAGTALEAARALGWTRRQLPFTDLDVLNQMLAVAETAAHLDVLVLQGRLSSSTDPDGVEIYQHP
ncbi:MAG: MBL fold metallo-hydrolase [Jatrophihabitantaceae bacterium]